MAIQKYAQFLTTTLAFETTNRRAVIEGTATADEAGKSATAPANELVIDRHSKKIW